LVSRLVEVGYQSIRLVLIQPAAQCLEGDALFSTCNHLIIYVLRMSS